MCYTSSVQYELLIVLYLDIHVGPDKNQYIPEKGYSIPTKRCINERVRLRPDFMSQLQLRLTSLWFILS